MRVISGSVGGIRLETLKGRGYRPTAERVREALFNILGPQIKGASFLDLYAGTGGIGIEALSRGAISCVFVERSREAARIIGRNLMKTGLIGKARILQCDALLALHRLAGADNGFDCIFLDPPYEEGMVETTLKKISDSALKLLTCSGIIIVEASKREKFRLEDNLVLAREERYGDTILAFIRLKSGYSL